MEIIPLIYLKKRKILMKKDGDLISLDDLLKKFDNDRKLYILDLDGLEKYKPNLCMYPKLSKKYKIWVDAGPRTLGDVVDSIMAGAINITVRRKIWPELSIPLIKEITDYEIYSDIHPENQYSQSIFLSTLNDVDGLVSFTNKEYVDADFKYASFLKNMCSKYKVYIYDSDQQNFSYWKKNGVNGLFIDIKKAMEVKKHEF
jgi:hypothetical protein